MCLLDNVHSKQRLSINLDQIKIGLDRGFVNPL